GQARQRRQDTRGRWRRRARRPRLHHPPAEVRGLVAAEGQARTRRELGGRRDPRGTGGDGPRRPLRGGAHPARVRRPQGPSEGRALVAHVRRRGRPVRPQRRGRRAPLGHSRRSRAAPGLRARPRAGARGTRAGV
ncbi:MAG: hypothetical protein AVDCRST_MAG53-3201, partial [uncultured Solirubrobacteraceae bacterium]